MSRSVQTPSINSNGVTDINSRYALTRQEVNDLIAELNTPGFLDNIAKLFSSPIDNIISLYKFPFDVKAQSPAYQSAMKRSYTGAQGGYLPLNKGVKL